jgi:hypothetical protein
VIAFFIENNIRGSTENTRKIYCIPGPEPRKPNTITKMVDVSKIRIEYLARLYFFFRYAMYTTMSRNRKTRTVMIAGNNTAAEIIV